MTDKTISDKKIVRTSPVEVSPISTLPPGLDEGNYRTSGSGGDGAYEAPILLDGRAGQDMGYLLDTPTGITVKSQTFRFNPDGSMVVDVVLSVPDVKGASNYEIRTALEN